MNVVDTLVEMGFSKEKAELAINRTGSNDVQIAMDWLLSHEDELAVPPAPPAAAIDAPDSVSDVETINEKAGTSDPETPPVAKSIQCDDCGKLFRTNEEVEFHASKSEEKKPLTEQEKKEQLSKIEAKLRQRRLEREAREKRRHYSKKRIGSKNEKRRNERLAKQRVREQIEQDKLTRKAKFGGAEISEPTAVIPAVAKPTPLKPTANYSEVKLQIRLPNGAVLTQSFGAKEPLSAVRLYIEMNRQGAEGPFCLMTSFPKKVFASDDYDKPLESLGK
ncbi:hypothetical protein NQ317_003298 [Molorchus minor]|uniref:UBX domain-containing protein 1 n=1 Tax=Molorchus minor TaxID=1323400 RepID=A0ABQ9J5N9_9CUCU|nr:hypothetical protein NQ317_003298 [Molorchus minor]